MDERKIQKDYVMNYLCRREDEGDWATAMWHPMWCRTACSYPRCWQSSSVTPNLQSGAV